MMLTGDNKKVAAGVNDAPALTQAEVGVAIGAALMSLSIVIVAINARFLKVKRSLSI